MRKYFIFTLLFGFCCFMLVGCQTSGPDQAGVLTLVSEEDGGTEKSTEAGKSVEIAEGIGTLNGTEAEDGAGILGVDVNGGVDVDLTTMSSTMVYAEVYNIMQNPQEYLGKTIRVKGIYTTSFYEATGLNYQYVLIVDAAACCQQGLEFIWNGDHTYPDDYPTVGTEIDVTGIFGSYTELDITYYYLAVDAIDAVS